MNENSTIAFLLLISIVILLYSIFASYLNIREIRRLRTIKYIARTQKEFGIARNSLFDLLREGELSDESITFLFLYLLDTQVMRNPDKHKILAKLMLESFFSENSPEELKILNRELTKESEHWSEKVRNTVFLNVSAMNSLMLSHSSFLQSIRFIADFALPIINKVLKKEFRIFNYMTGVAAKRSQSIKIFLNSKNELKRLACLN